ncbi:Fe-S cluster assembly protein HesB [Tenggerimyces flavus]|uniref:Fe-S cluster assembly protein HesB n=1 Tax=Tenggerimyces flavus TaxID=1708749 RepID=A0ABV7YIQ6_9ACTN|nr:Fe-S cluster assembly protein HesB [Tenggerimyces flavus]MBM7789228.1 Fe-S cluster assembly iron-binding protein IscA [Tenggerimyces flavus]
MLTLTNNAATVIKSLTSNDALPDSSGLRIAARQENLESLQLGVAPEPVQGDSVVEDQGARVFLGEHAHDMLDEMILDAEVDEQGSVQFFLASQAAARADTQQSNGQQPQD